MMMRLSALRRLVEFMDAHSGRMFDLSAAMHAKKGGNILAKVVAKAQIEVSPPVAKATPKVDHASPSKGAEIVNASTPGPMGKRVAPPDPLRIKAIEEAERAINKAAKGVKDSIKAHAGAEAVRLDVVRSCLKSRLHQALKDDGCTFASFSDLRKEASGRGVPAGEMGITLVKELMRNQEAHMVGAMASALQKYAPVPDKKRKEAVVTKGRSASRSPGPPKKAKNAREPGPQKEVTWALNKAEQGSSGGRGRPSTAKAEVPRFQDITEEAAAAATRGSDAHEHLALSMRIHDLQDCTQSELAKGRGFALDGMTIDDALKCKVPFQDADDHKTVEMLTMCRLMSDVESGLIELEEVISVELDEAGEVLLPPGFEPEGGCNPREDGPYLPVPTSLIKGSLNRVRPGFPILLPMRRSRRWAQRFLQILTDIVCCRAWALTIFPRLLGRLSVGSTWWRCARCSVQWC
jgi:hypothetical protein